MSALANLNALGAIASLFYPPVEVFGSTVAIGAASLVVTRSGGPPWTTLSLGLPTGEVTSAMREIDANTILIGTNKGRMLRISWTGASWSKTQLFTYAVPPKFIAASVGISWAGCSRPLAGIPSTK